MDKRGWWPLFSQLRVQATGYEQRYQAAKEPARGFYKSGKSIPKVMEGLMEAKGEAKIEGFPMEMPQQCTASARHHIS